MKFKVSEDVDAPQQMVFQHFTSFKRLESDARNRGAKLKRIGAWTTPAVGVAWSGEITVRDKVRPIEAHVSDYQPSDRCVVLSVVGGMECTYEMTFVALTPKVTRVALVLNLAAKTLTARLILQTLKLARGRVMGRLQSVLERDGKSAEAAYKQ